MRAKIILSKSALVVFAFLAVGLVSSAHAATITWSGAGTDWNTAANWNSGAGPVPGAADTAVLPFPKPANSPNLAAAGTCLILQVNDAYTITGAGTLTVATAGNIAVNNAAATISCGLAFGGTDTIFANPGASLSVTGTVALVAANILTVDAGGTGSVTLNASGGITGAGTSITKVGTGTLSLLGANSFTTSATPGINIANGTVVAQSNLPFGAAANAVTVASGGTLAINGTNGPWSISQTPTITINGTGFNNTGAIRNIVGNNTITNSNATNTVTLASASSIQSDSGTLTISNTNAAHQLQSSGAARSI